LSLGHLHERLFLYGDLFLDLRIHFYRARSFLDRAARVANNDATFLRIESERILKLRLLRLFANVFLHIRKGPFYVKGQAERSDKEQADQDKVGRRNAICGLVLIARARQETIRVRQDDDMNHDECNPESANGQECPPPKSLKSKLDKRPEGKFGNLCQLLFGVLKHGHLFCLQHKLGVECNVLSHLTAHE
jgi:hypothetical protein